MSDALWNDADQETVAAYLAAEWPDDDVYGDDEEREDDISNVAGSVLRAITPRVRELLTAERERVVGRVTAILAEFDDNPGLCLAVLKQFLESGATDEW